MRYLIVIVFLLLAAPAWAADCTDGTDCYCDCVEDKDGAGNNVAEYSNTACQTKSVPIDDDVLLCEDYEAASMWPDPADLDKYEGCTAGSDTETESHCFDASDNPIFGPWYDDTDNANNRGANSYWQRTYGVAGGCIYTVLDPTPPALGNACIIGGQGVCWGPGEWSIDDPWSVLKPPADWLSSVCIDIVRDGEFDDEIEGITPNTVHDGLQSFGHRVGQGQEGIAWETAGFIGGVTYGSPQSQIGITSALAYSSNSGDSGVWDHMWKHDESRNAQAGEEFWHLGNTGCGTNSDCGDRSDLLPYTGFLFHTSEAACDTALEGATVHVGRVEYDTVGGGSCWGNSFRYGADPTIYLQERDFPWGTWGCQQAHISGLGTGDVTIRLWHDGVLILWISGFDGAAFHNQGFTSMVWNAFANANQNNSDPPEIPTSVTTYRYQDNVHWTAAAEPASCAEIGFGEAGPTPTPTATATATATPTATSTPTATPTAPPTTGEGIALTGGRISQARPLEAY